MFRRTRAPRWKAYVAGMAGGAAGTLAMGLFLKGAQALKTSRQERLKEPPERREEEAGSEHQPQAERSRERPKEHDISVIGRQHREGEPATAAIARVLYAKIAKREPEERTKKRLSNAVHWSYGTEMGAMYGLVRGSRKGLDWKGGLFYGAALWVLGDEIAVPLLGLAEGPKAHAVSLHARTLGAHLAYGVTTAAATQLAQRALKPV